MPSATIESRAVFGDLAQRGAIAQFADVFDQSLMVADNLEILQRIFNVETTTDSIIRDTSVVGLALFTEVDEGDAFEEDANMVGYETVYTVKNLGKTVTVTKNRIDDTDFKRELDTFRHAAVAARLTKGKYTFNILNGGFVTSITNNSFTLYRMDDGVAAFSVVHPRRDGGSSQSNASGTGITLTELNLETGRLALVKQLTDRGLPIEFMGKLTLAVPDDLVKDATIFANTSARPSTANNDINFYEGMLDVVSSKWLNSGNGGSSTAWYLIDQNLARLKLYIRQDAQFYATVEAKTRNVINDIDLRLAAGHSDWRGSWATKGDGNSYSS